MADVQGQLDTTGRRVTALVNRAQPDRAVFVPLTTLSRAGTPSLSHELERLREAPPHFLGARLAADCGPTCPDHSPHCDWASRLVKALRNDEDRALRSIVDGIADTFRATMADHWRPRIAHHLHHDLAYRTQLEEDFGPLALLTSVDRDTRPNAGIPSELVLMPCAFGHLRTHASVTPAGCRVLVYPARLGTTERRQARDPLATLLGAGRAAALRALRVPTSTSGLAQHLGTTSPVASRHAQVLREAGLITTVRKGRAVLHQLTAVGESLLTASRDHPPGTVIGL
ncbi:helix-turn-helix domain-containing protein [Streptomyces sp. NRRL WC-3742]|uniref:helix-turn-helix domain-containing protein n=1 Tax=Streptomyces sp. NRRL WC-3742 TaxID=1463934 RepID=UPI0004C9E2CA|nr:helix-turn-helix domain-containing protein [Streptomyces sp. NRRL WC-3742]